MADYTYWQRALAGNFGPVHDSDPQPGFWRKRTHRAGPFTPVAIWEDGGKMVALVNGKEADASELWTYVCRYPILESWYHDKVAGRPWPDEDKFVNDSFVPPMGDNGPPDDTELLKGQIDAAAAGAEDYRDILTDETASKAQSLRSRLLELSGEADKKREALKKPFFEAGKAVDAKFQPLVKAAKAAADAIRDALGAHETRKARAAEAERKAAEEIRIKAEREATKARAAAELAGKPVPAPAAPPQPPEPTPAPVAAIRGAYGRAASIKLVRVAKVTDQDALYTGLRTHKELIELMAKLAQRATDAGITLPGVEIEEQRKVS